MTDFPVLQRTRADLHRRFAEMKLHDPRRGHTARALVRATCRLMRRQVEARARPARPAAGADLLALMERGGAPSPSHTEMRA